MRRSFLVVLTALACAVPGTAAAAATPAPTVTAGLTPTSAVAAGTSRVYTAAFVVSQLTSVRYSVGLPTGFSKPTALQLPLPTGCQTATTPVVAAAGTGWTISGTLTCKKLALFALAFKTTATLAGQATLPWSVTSSTNPAQGKAGSFGFSVKPAAVASVSLAVSNSGLPANGTSQAKLIAVPLDAYGNLVTAQLQPLVSLVPAVAGDAVLPTVSGFAPGSTSNTVGTYVGTFVSSTSRGVATVRVKATAGGAAVTSAPVTITQVQRFTVRTDGGIVSFFDPSRRPGAPVLQGGGDQAIHLVWTAPQDVNPGDSPFATDLVVTLPFGSDDFMGPGPLDRFQVFNGTGVGGSCTLGPTISVAFGTKTSTLAIPAPHCQAGQTIELDLTSVGFADPRSFSAALDFQQTPVATSPLDVVDAMTVTPQAPAHYLTVDPPVLAADLRSATVVVTLHNPGGDVDTSDTSDVEFALGRCGETYTWTPQEFLDGQATVTLMAPDPATWQDPEDGVIHPLWSVEDWYFRTTDEQSVLAGQQVTFGDPDAPDAILLDGQGDVPPDYSCPGHSKF